MNARRSTLGVATLGGRIYAVGGFDGSVGKVSTYISYKTNILAGLYTCEAFDPRLGEWQMVRLKVTLFIANFRLGVCQHVGHP
jgi:hypothetical protein